MAGRRSLAPNPAGAHFLRDRAITAELIRSSGIGRDDLVLDLGAGYGALTAGLAATGARVIAVEIDARLAGRLERRFAGAANVRVVHGDVRQIPLPRRRFHVVASIPFAATTTLLRRLLGDPAVSLAGTDLIISWGAAKALTTPVPRNREIARWRARYRIALLRRVPAGSFSPPPGTAAAHVSIRPVRHASPARRWQRRQRHG